MPLLYIDSHRVKAEMTGEINKILKDFHHGSVSMLDSANRMKPLDVTKVLLGIQSSRECVKRFSQDGSVWARRQDYDYAQVLELCTGQVQAFYVEQLATKKSH